MTSDAYWPPCHASRLISAILWQKDDDGDYFGVAFSISNCAIVKVAKGAHAMTFSHSDALQFVPSFFTDSPSAPGMTHCPEFVLAVCHLANQGTKRSHCHRSQKKRTTNKRHVKSWRSTT